MYGAAGNANATSPCVRPMVYEPGLKKYLATDARLSIRRYEYESKEDLKNVRGTKDAAMCNEAAITSSTYGVCSMPYEPDRHARVCRRYICAVCNCEGAEDSGCPLGRLRSKN